MTPQEKLTQILYEHPNSPFLFVGSGFSQRYLGSPTWEDLLRSFCPPETPFEYYIANSDSKMPQCASLIARDYAEHWWKSDDAATMREKYQKEVNSKSSPLKIAVSEKLSREFRIPKDPVLVNELNALRAFNAEGIITTNWDKLLESLFPGYKVYIGQQSVVSQTPQNVGEIYKIHGCCSKPNSLVLTQEDYDLFKDKQAYLAAKLITLFVEHPIIFIGYSISDPNVLDLLRSIIRGLGSSEINQLQKNLIFLQRSKEGRPVGVFETILVVDDVQLPVTNLVSDDFCKIYEALSETKLKMPARLLRFCKEQLYELVTSKEPSSQLCLVDLDNIKDKSEIEFVVGIGVAGGHFSERGYARMGAKDLYGRVVNGTPKLEAERILDQTLPELDQGSNFLPVHFFLQEAGIKSLGEVRNASVERLAKCDRDKFKTSSYAKAARREVTDKDLKWLVDNHPPEKVAVFLPYLSDEQIDLAVFKSFAEANFEKAFEGGYTTIFRKAFCFYDFLQYGGSNFER